MELADVGRHAREVLDRVNTVVVGKRDALELVLAGMLAGGHVLLEDVPGLGKTLAARSLRPGPRPGLHPRCSSRPTCCRPTSPVRSSTTSASGEFDFRAGPGVHRPAARRRDQPHPAQDAGGAAGGHAGAAGHRRGRHLPAGRAVPRARHREPDRVRGHLPAARGPARPVPAPGVASATRRRTRSGTCCAAGWPAAARRPTLEPVVDAAGLLAMQAARGGGDGRGPRRPLLRRRWPRPPGATRRCRSAPPRAARSRCCCRPRPRRARRPRLRHPRGRQGRGPGRAVPPDQPPPGDVAPPRRSRLHRRGDLRPHSRAPSEQLPAYTGGT